MADLIKIKGGSGEVPELEDKELGYSRDEKALYIGTKNGNVKLCGADDVATLQGLIEGLKARVEALEKK